MIEVTRFRFDLRNSFRRLIEEARSGEGLNEALASTVEDALHQLDEVRKDREQGGTEAIDDWLDLYCYRSESD